MTRIPRSRPAFPGQLGGVAVLVLAGATVRRTLDERRIADLTARIEVLEHTTTNALPAAGMTIRAPFTVTDAGNKPVFSVLADGTLRGIQVMDAARHPVFVALSDHEGGYLAVATPDYQRMIELRTGQKASFLSIDDGPNYSERRVSIGLDTAGAPSVQLFNKAHKRQAALGVEDSLGARLTLFDGSDNLLATLSAPPGGGLVKVLNARQTRVGVMGIVGEDAAVALRDGLQTDRIKLAILKDGSAAYVHQNKAHWPVFTITEGSRQDGLFQLYDKVGAVMLEGGVTPDHKGTVRVGPNFNCSGKMGLTVTDCIVGHDP